MDSKLRRIRHARNIRGTSQISEFAPVLYVLFFLTLMPLLDMAAVFVAGGIQYLATNDFAAKASMQPDYPSALNSMTNEAYQFQSNGLAQFLQMAPEGGFTGCGDDMYILSTNVGTGAVTSSAANLALTEPIDTKTSVLELSVKSQYSVKPLVSLRSVPLLGSVPGLGQPMVLAFNASRPIEHPGGLISTTNPTNQAGGGGSVTPFPRVASAPASASPTAITWRDPNIFAKIQAAGQTVVSVNVFVVYGNQNWQSSGVSLAPGQAAWIDTSAVGLWGSNSYEGATLTADGGADTAATNGDSGGPYIDMNGNLCALLGYVGNPPPVSTQTIYGTSPDPNMFVVGNTLTNYQLPSSGPLSFVQNWTMNTSNGIGEQEVRIIVTTK